MGTTVADIAVMLGVPENTVKSYMHRARKLLSAMLRDKGFADV
jgi:DNA-directed RNA polymerase specialized sigma24 family protein